ncbi:MAG: invasion associated locus B family protein [Hyphomicrobium aestuarii]|nr:invasion associated locus B family protein [Hyphomicrobium aestuarii]
MNTDVGHPAQTAQRASLTTFATVIALVVLNCFCGPSAQAAIAIRTFNGWTLYSETAQQQICFLAASPAETAPAGIKRDPALLYISAWPKEGVRTEVSFKLGFPARKASEPVVSVTGPGSAPPTAFRMFVKDDRAFVADATQELKLIEAMRKGSRLVVQSTSERGTSVTDTFPLAGITAGLQALATGCP